jgi:DNA-binding MarR family transcriptional regulator
MAGLSEAPERTRRMSDIAAFADGSLSRLSQVVSRLERKGWVRRSPDPTDGRYTLATLTGAGWDKVVETAPGHVGDVRRLVFDPLTKAQVRQLTNIGQRIVHAVADDERRAYRPA